MWIPWSRSGAKAAQFVKVRGESARPKGRIGKLNPQAKLRKSLWWGRMEKWKYAYFRSIVTTQSSDLVWDTTCLIERILNFSRMTEQFSWLRFKIEHNHPILLGMIKYRLYKQDSLSRGRTTSCILEYSLLVPLPEPARDPTMSEWPRWKWTECDSLFLQCAGPTETQLAVVSTLPNSLLRLPVSWDWPLVCLELLARFPKADYWQGTAALAALETPQGVALRFWAEETEKRSLETAAPWSTVGGRVGRPISWGHWGETGTEWWGVHRSFPEGPALRSPEPQASGRSSQRLSSENEGLQMQLLLFFFFEVERRAWIHWSAHKLVWSTMFWNQFIRN